MTVTVSAIVPSYNRLNYIRRAIDSILAQTLPLDEIIVIDDGSTDGTADALRAWYAAKLRVVTQARSGVSGARHRGIHEARGDWIAFLDSDDDWAPDRNRKLSAVAASAPDDVAWVFGDLQLVTDQGCESTVFEANGFQAMQNPAVFEDSLSVQYPFQFAMLPASLVRRSALLEFDCFSQGLQHSEDVLAGFQIATRYKFAAVPYVVGRYFRTSDLEASSASRLGLHTPDYFRARMMAFALVIRSGHTRPWNRLYAAQVRGLCQVLADHGPISRFFGLHQFRFGGLSLKGVAFCLAVMGGSGTLKLWKSAATLRAARQFRR